MAMVHGVHGRAGRRRRIENNNGDDGQHAAQTSRAPWLPSCAWALLGEPTSSLGPQEHHSNPGRSRPAAAAPCLFEHPVALSNHLLGADSLFLTAPLHRRPLHSNTFRPRAPHRNHAGCRWNLTSNWLILGRGRGGAAAAASSSSLRELQRDAGQRRHRWSGLRHPDHRELVVITKGAARIAEVAARFTLDAMPGKQMAIDADLNAGDHRRAEAAGAGSDLREEARLLRRHGRCREVRPRRRGRRC